MVKQLVDSDSIRVSLAHQLRMNKFCVNCLLVYRTRIGVGSESAKSIGKHKLFLKVDGTSPNYADCRCPETIQNQELLRCACEIMSLC